MSKKTAPKKNKMPKVEKHKPFDLSIDRPEQAMEIVDALEALQSDRGWLLLKQIFEGNIAVLEAAILRKISPDDGRTSLKEEECDRLRDRLAYLEELLGKPQEIIKKLTQPNPEAPDYDPYDKVPIRRVGVKE